jgi:hypothetical protein
MKHPQSNTFLPLAAACALALSAVSAAAAPEASTNRDDTRSLRNCIEATSTTSWTPYDDHTILVWSSGRAFQVTTNRCPRLADPLARLTKKISGGTSICSPHDVQLFVSDSADSIPSPCFIQSITPLTKDEAKAIESRRH